MFCAEPQKRNIQEGVPAPVGGRNEKWFQVTHFPACPPAGMLGPDSAIEVPFASAFTPRSGFYPPRISAPAKTRSDSLSKLASRCDLSLPPGGCSSLSHLSELVVPGLHLRRAHRTFFLARSAVGSLPRLAFLRDGEDPRPTPVAKSRALRSRRLSGFAPLWDFRIPQAQHSTKFAVGKLASRTFGFPSLPVLARPLRLAVADHRSRLVSFRLARCSVNLLEPSPCCLETNAQSTKTVHFRTDFRNLFFVYIQYVGFLKPRTQCE